MSSTRPVQGAAGEAAVLRAALPAVLAGDPHGVEVDERHVGRLAGGDQRGGQLEQPRARGHPLDEQLELEHAGEHEARVERGERRLEAGRAHRRLLEGHLLLIARVRRVVGGDAVDRARAQALDERPAVGLGGERRVHLHARVHPAHVLLGEQQVMGRDLRADREAARLGLRPTASTEAAQLRCWKCTRASS